MVAFVASTVLTAANLNTAFNALTIRTVTGTSDTLVLADNGGAVTYSNASATTSTIPPNSSIAYATGTKIILANLGAGVVTVTAGSGVTVNGTLTIAQNAGGTCIKTATNTWSFLPFGSGAPTLTSADVTSTTGSPTITTSGANTIYQFTGSGTIVLGKAGLCDAVIVGGGGGSGFSADNTRNNGGAGAGGIYGLGAPTIYLDSGTLTVTVGGGGASLSNGGTSGVASSLKNYVAFGGANSAALTAVTIPYGGSAGGANNASNARTAFVSQQGNDGGTPGGLVVLSTEGAGGGGGAGAVGGNGTTSVGGVGGAGLASTITGASVTLGGGGGGMRNSGSSGAGGAGGGGAAGTTGTAGGVNTGGGAGAGGTSAGAAGGSGIVIVRVVT